VICREPTGFWRAFRSLICPEPSSRSTLPRENFHKARVSPSSWPYLSIVNEIFDWNLGDLWCILSTTDGRSCVMIPKMSDARKKTLWYRLHAVAKMRSQGNASICSENIRGINFTFEPPWYPDFHATVSYPQMTSYMKEPRRNSGPKRKLLRKIRCSNPFYPRRGWAVQKGLVIQGKRYLKCVDIVQYSWFVSRLGIFGSSLIDFVIVNSHWYVRLF